MELDESQLSEKLLTKKLDERLVKLERNSNENQLKLDNICSTLLTIRSGLILIESKMKESIVDQIKLTTVKEINEMIKDEFNIEKVLWQEEFEKLKQNFQLQLETNKENLQKKFEAEKKTLYEHFDKEKTSLCKIIWDKMHNQREEFEKEKQHLQLQFEMLQKAKEKQFQCEKDTLYQHFEKEKVSLCKFLCDEIQLQQERKNKKSIVQQEIVALKNEISNQKILVKTLEQVFKQEISNQNNTLNLSDIEFLKSELKNIEQNNLCNYDSFENKLQKEVRKLEQEQHEFAKNILTLDAKANVQILTIVEELKQVRKMFDERENGSNIQMDICEIRDQLKEIKKTIANSNIILKLEKVEELFQNSNQIEKHFQNFDSDLKLIHFHEKLLNQLQPYIVQHEKIIETVQKEIESIKIELGNIEIEIDGLYCNKKMTSLLDACEKNCIPKVEKLLQQDLDVNVINEDGFSPLYFAVMNNKVALADILLKHNADINCKTRYGVTPLIQATILTKLPSSNYDMIRSLLHGGADPNISVKDGLTAFHFAVAYNDILSVRMLLEFNADVKTAVKEITPICIATHLQYSDIITELENHGAEIDVISELNTKEVFIAKLLEVLKQTNENLYLKRFCLLIIYCLCKLLNNKEIIGQAGTIPILLKQLDYTLKFSKFHSIAFSVWIIFASLSEMAPNNCSILMEKNCLQYFLNSFEMISKNKICLSAMITTFSNIIEFKIYRKQLMNKAFISILFKGCDIQTLNEQTITIFKILSYIASDGDEYWTITTPKYLDVLKQLEDTIDKLTFSKMLNINFNSLESLFELLTHCDSYQVQLFGAWILANGMEVLPHKYYPLIKLLDGFQQLTNIVENPNLHSKVKKLVDKVINNYINYTK